LQNVGPYLIFTNFAKYSWYFLQKTPLGGKGVNTVIPLICHPLDPLLSRQYRRSTIATLSAQTSVVYAAFSPGEDDSPARVQSGQWCRDSNTFVPCQSAIQWGMGEGVWEFN